MHRRAPNFNIMMRFAATVGIFYLFIVEKIIVNTKKA
jgi:hypothetical protein